VDASGNVVANHGFLWKDGAFTQIDFPGSSDTVVFGINSRGDIVGGWDTGVTSPNEHGFVCSKGSCFSFDVSSAVVTQGDAISIDGVVVGVYVESNGITHGFEAVGSNLTTLDFPHATLTLYWGINAHGQIVGNYFSADGVEHGFLATRR